MARFLAVLLTPALIAVATVAGRRWQHRVGGLVSAFPAIVGPLLVLTAREHGAAFTAEAANGVLLALPALSAFIVGYGRTARTHDWPASLAVGWTLAAAIGVCAGAVRLGAPAGVGVSVLSLYVASRLLPAETRLGGPAPPMAGELPVQMGAGALLVLGLASAADRVGPVGGGILAALPVLACVLAVRTHRNHGVPALLAMLDGMLLGMTGFVVFCGVVQFLVLPLGAPRAFALATLAALATHGLAACELGRMPTRARDGAGDARVPR